MMKKLLLFPALLCATMIAANEAAKIATDELEYFQFDTVFIVGDTVLFPHYPVPEPLDVPKTRKATLSDPCHVDSIIGTDELGNHTSRNEYLYDEAGNRISEISYKWVDGKKVGVSRTWRQYTGQTLSASATFKWDNDRWIGKDSTHTHYYENGLPKSKGNFTWDKTQGENGDWRYKDLTEYEYDAFCSNPANNPSLTIVSKWSSSAGDGGALIPYEKRGHKHDAKGRIIADSSMVFSNGEWVGTGRKKIIKSYDENDNLAIEEEYSGWENGAWKGDKRKTHKYFT